MLELVKRQLKINVYGTEVLLNYPTVREFREFDAKKDDEKQFDLMCDFLVRSGMDESLINELEPAHLTQIINELVGSNEKK